MKCGSCQKIFGAPNMRTFETGVPFEQTRWKCVAFTCPLCQTIISAQVDPIAIKTDIINGVVNKLRN